MNPTRITPRSQTLIDNIFYNDVQSKIIAGNIATDISHHLTQFTAIPGRHTEHLNEDIYRRNYKTLNHDKFKEDFNKIAGPLCSLVITLMMHAIISLRKLKFLLVSIFPLKKFPKENQNSKKESLGLVMTC